MPFFDCFHKHKIILAKKKTFSLLCLIKSFKMGLREIQDLKNRANDPKPPKRYVIPKVSKKRQKKLEEQKDMIKLDHEFYEEHWRSCPHKCEQCGLNLGKEPLTIFFHHALPKRNYPKLRHAHENIIVLCGNCHSQAEIDIDKVPVVKRRTEEIEKKLLNDTL